MTAPRVRWPGQRASAVLLLLGLAALAGEGLLAWRAQQLQAQVQAVLAAPPPPRPAGAASGSPAASAGLPVAVQASAVASSATASGAASSLRRSVDDDEAPELRLARALVLAAADDDRALALYHGLEQAGGALGATARFNSANLLLRQGLAQRNGPQPGQAIALIELAKQGYRGLLREQPDDWPARYNLERALRLQPEAEAGDDAPGGAPQHAERAATTMRAFSPGLP